ncbi:MAG: hypothetical protein EXS13_09010 [Planctomycetes bacterium]|nr:hypothetical protein [Planctomycetota bacterium]
MAARSAVRGAYGTLLLLGAGCGVKVEGPAMIPYVEVFESAQFGDLEQDYGCALLLEDTDQDGEAELITGSPSRDPDGDGIVLFVPPSSLTVTEVLVPWRRVGDSSQHHDQFGASLATGDWNGDGRIDVAVGDPRADVGATAEAGETWVFFGPLDPTESTRLSSSLPGSGARFGETLATGDFDHDGFADLAVGAPHPAEISAALDGPSLEVFFGPDFARRERWDAGGAGGQFGSALVAVPRAEGGAALVAGAPEWDGGSGAAGGFFAWERFVDSQSRQFGAPTDADLGIGRAGTCGDFDGDGREELVIASLTGRGSVAFFDPAQFALKGRLTLPRHLADRQGASVAALPDVSRDHAQELLLLSSRADDPAALLFSPGRTLSHLTLDRAAAAVVAGNFDLDDELEYLISTPTRLKSGGGLSDLSLIDISWRSVRALRVARPAPRVIAGVAALRGE